MKWKNQGLRSYHCVLRALWVVDASLIVTLTDGRPVSCSTRRRISDRSELLDSLGPVHHGLNLLTSVANTWRTSGSIWSVNTPHVSLSLSTTAPSGVSLFFTYVVAVTTTLWDRCENSGTRSTTSAAGSNGRGAPTAAPPPHAPL